MYKNIIYLTICCFTLLSGCKEQEILVFDDLSGINFLKYDTREGWNETMGNLSVERNFGYFTDKWDVKTDTIQVQAKLEGKLSEEARNVRLVYDFNPDEPHVELIFQDNYAFKPNEYLIEFVIVVKRPPVRDQSFNLSLAFDYGHSDVVAGTKERQTFRLSIKDELTLENVMISEDLWNNMIAPVLGEYSNTKLRFMAYALQSRNFSGMAGGVTASQKQTIVDKLNEYNEAHPGQPLRDENGEAVTFEPII